MTEELEQQEELIPVARFSGQDIQNPNPPSLIEVPHEGHKADAESWKRTKNKNYLKKRATQLLNIGSDDKSLKSILLSRRY